MPTDDVENIDNIDKGRDLLLVNQPQDFPCGTKRMPQIIQRHSRVNLHRSTHSK